MTDMAAFLKPLTPEAEKSLGTRLYQLSKFPFRVGRESRRKRSANYPNSRRRSGSSTSNDLYLIETNPPLNVSREHFQIELHDGKYFIVDRGSTCGTLVEGNVLGGGRNGGRHPLNHGDVIIVGTSESRHIFKFLTAQS